LAHDLESEYGRITVTEAILTAVRKRARRTKQLLGT
jgi:hypothetical protein